MKKIFLILLVILPFLSFSQVEKVDTDLLDSELQKSFNAWNVPGFAVAIVQGNQIVYEKGFGVLDAGKKAKVNQHTNFAIASNTKAFTAAALAILVDQGQINWDDKVTDYIPWFQLYDPFVTNQMTIRDLLCHRTGLETFSGDLIWYASDHSREEIIRRARYLEPKYGFREKFGYSNIMYLTAGQIVEYVTDTTWDDFLKYRIFEPLGMTRTNTSISINQNLDNVAECHALVDDKNIVIPYVNWDNIAPAGSINSNVHDVAKWLILQLNRGEYKGKRIFSQQVADEMWKPNTVQDVSAFSRSVYPSTHLKAYALGWGLYDYNSYLIVTHNGGYDGMISQTVLIPELDLGFVVLTNNLSMFYTVALSQVLDYLTKAEIDSKWSDNFLRIKQLIDNYDKEDKQAWENTRISDTKPSHNLIDYVGIYKSDVYGDVEVLIKSDNLYLKMLHTSIYHGQLKHWHYDTFTVKFEEALSLPSGTVSFIDDKYGEITEIKIDIPNPDFDFTELKLYKEQGTK
ncbi:MAG: serine hydrolase [Bacteroidales bacterium]|nr:serine hydrolase [Bacteroidales bacterium]MDD4218205.1 serine hydrolase [Bacteroidales bacterium]MDY0143035.1 serine hydrolase [Bacteroidales bacterium]